MTDKGTHGNQNFTLLENDKLIQGEAKISDIFNDYYINIIIENITGNQQEKDDIQITLVTKV